MLEQQLRQKVAGIISGWVGATKGSARHKEILQIYNSHTPLARGYKVKVGDAYCATTVSATWISAGIAEYTGPECSVNYFIQVAKQKGSWVENDAYVPKLGDAVVYDWGDGPNYATTDNRGSADHIGIVTKPGKTSFTVTEGNMSGGKVGTRILPVNGRYIRGFIVPDYAAIAKAMGGSNTTTTEPAAKETAAAAPAPAAAADDKVLRAEKFDKAIAGTYVVTASDGLNIRSGPGTDHRVLRAVSKGAKVRNYGYYTERNGAKWYYIRIGATTGFVHSDYLKKA